VNDAGRGYELLDSGHGRKLERVGPWVVDRTAPQAFWAPTLAQSEWRRADARHHRSDQGGGRWETRTQMPDRWEVAIEGLTLHAKLTPFGHLGLFAEHAAFWPWLTEVSRRAAALGPFEVLNLFAYTGGATLACARGGAAVCHVDAAKGVVDWARDNATASGLAARPVRWIVDDCTAFLKREARRGHRYQALILDPPSYGRAGRGVVWKIEEALPSLLDACRAVLDEAPAFILFSCHSPSFSPIVIENLLTERFERPAAAASGEMTVLASGSRRALPAGVFVRWSAGST
jgi:23S rRNA (cytosine1962-C5)-methyltransferase